MTIGMLSSAAADVITFSTTSGGTFDTATQIDVNADGAQAATASYEVEEATLGNYTCSSIGEEVATGPTAECPGGLFIIDATMEMGYSVGTCTFPNGDQFYFQAISRTDCCDLAGVCVAEETGETTGGTGQFEGATGPYEATAPQIIQIFDPVSNQLFGSFTGTSTGTLDAPNFNGGGTGPDCNGDGIVNGLDLIDAGC